jgi:hypothetical protein
VFIFLSGAPCRHGAPLSAVPHQKFGQLLLYQSCLVLLYQTFLKMRACPLQAPLADTLRLFLLYQTWVGQLLLLLPATWWILSWQHHRIARHADSPKSKKDIPTFVKVCVTNCHRCRA